MFTDTKGSQILSHQACPQGTDDLGALGLYV